MVEIFNFLIRVPRQSTDFLSFTQPAQDVKVTLFEHCYDVRMLKIRFSKRSNVLRHLG